MPATEALNFPFLVSILEESSNLICVKDEQNVVLYANDAFLEMYPESDREGIIGTCGLDRMSDARRERILEQDRLAFERGKLEVVDSFTDATGRERVIIVKKMAFTGEDGQRLLLSINTDITELTRREQALVQTNQQLATFAAMAAHDLRSPLATFTGLIDLIKMDPDTSLSADAASYLDTMRRSAVQLASHISGLLSTYKANHDEHLNRRLTDLGTLWEEVNFNLREAINTVGAKVSVDPLPRLNIDAGLFHHLLHNLVENSIKYRKHNQAPRIHLHHTYATGIHTFCLEDDGRGMSEAEAARAFQIYGQGESAVSGIGLGLSLCKKVVELHKGRIWVDRSYSEGCRICFSVPEL